jgi:hypothetical protein
MFNKKYAINMVGGEVFDLITFAVVVLTMKPI